MKRLWLIGLLALLPSLAAGQGVVNQSGSVVVGHAPAWSVNRVQRDAGSADGNGPGLTELLQVNPPVPAGTGPGGTHFCMRDAPATSPNHFLCLDAGAGGGGLINYGAANGALLAPLSCRINAQTYDCVNTGAGNILGPNSSTVGNLASFNGNDGKLLADFNIPKTAVTAGRAIFYQPVASFSPIVPGVIVTPDGSTVNCAGTLSSCFQEFVTALGAKGWSADIYSVGGAPSASFGISSHVPIVYPPLRQQTIHFHGVFVGCDPAVLTACETFDSCFESSVIYEGSQHGGSPSTGGSSSVSVLFDARTPSPIEGITAIAGCNFELGNVFHNAAAGLSHATIQVSLVHGGVVGAYFSAREINGAGGGGLSTANYCFLIDSPGALIAWEGNTVDVFGDTHLCKLGGLQEGLSLTNQANFTGNQYHFAAIKLEGSDSSCGINLFGQNDTVSSLRISNEQGTFGWGLCLTGGSIFNTVVAGVSGATVATVNDTSGEPNNYIINGRWLQLMVPGVAGQINGQALSSFNGGAGATLLAGSSNYSGTMVIGGAGSQQTAAIAFGINYFQIPTCFAQSNQVATFMVVSISSTSGITWAARDAAGALKIMPVGSTVSWMCQ